jgi:hypothetical protein
MPTLFETLDNRRRLFTVIPGIVAFVLGLMEALGLLPKKRGRLKNEGDKELGR